MFRVLTLLVFLCFAVPASALEIGPRRLDVDGALDTKAGNTLATNLMRLSAQSDAPVYVVISATRGTAQGVMIAREAIRSVRAPVVAVVLAPVEGAGAALAIFADQVWMNPSAQLLLTEIDYQGVAKPKAPKAPKAAKTGDEAAGEGDVTPEQPEPYEVFMQQAREGYLEMLWQALDARVGLKGKGGLKVRIEAEGGVAISAQEASRNGIGAQIIKELTAEAVPTEKLERKVITTRQLTRTAPVPD